MVAARAPRAKAESRIVCAILAAQAADLRTEIISVANVTIEFLYQISNAEAAVTETVPGDAVAVTASGSTVDAFAFTQAQRLDRVSQMAGVLASALERLAASAKGLTADELSLLYISEEQHRIHQDVLPKASGERR